MAASRSPALSFRTILFLIAIAGVLPAIVFSGLLLKRFADNERTRAENGLIDSTRAIARGIDTQFAIAEAAALALAGSAFLQTGNLTEFEKRLRRTAAETGRDFVLVDSGGGQLMNTLVPEGRPLSTNFPNLL